MRRPTGSPRSIRRTVLPALLACATVVLLVAPGGAVARASLGSHAVVPTHALLHRGRSVAGPPRLVPPPASSVPAGNWTNLSKNSTFAPPSRQAFVMAYDPLIGAAVLFGGLDASSNVLGDTWEYVRGNWTPVHSTAS
ncbi:MAG TPA: hypothetical protein VMH78_06140, partial [Thermoplasmata archaeon]|nr:hypothetical protein [Thermoplasmata archaeon]